ncbi:MAG: hypothetical protein ABFD54_00190 [Armatimonadota bacterium]|nr:hypothetical protein [bacterium]
MKNNAVPGLLLAATAMILSVQTTPAVSATLGTKVLKGAVVGFAVTKTAKPLDKFINTVTFNHGVRTHLATKVVPILSVGEKGYVGGAQVTGPKSMVDRVDAVFEYEKNFSNNNYRAKILVPSASLNPLKLERVAKVGVTAVIDVAVDGKLKYQTVGTGIQAGDVIRGAAVLVAVKNAGSAINKGLNTITFNKGMATKVVPMGSVGEKAYLGAAQVSAAGNSIGGVNAVWQYEDLFSSGQFRVKILVPTTSSNPLKMKRVDGAGITAIVDMALSEQKDVQKNRTDGWNRWIGDSRRVTNNTKNYNLIKKDNGKHKGWYIGKHKGWDKKK